MSSTRTTSVEWSVEEKKQLLNAVVEMGGKQNTKSYKTVELSLKWENIKIGGKSTEECRAMYQRLTGKVRRYRTMQEIIADALVLVDGPGKPVASEYPDMPKKPLTAFSLFVMKRSKKFPDIKGTQKMKVFAVEWNDLSEEKKEKYKKKYLKMKKKYEEELEVFRQNHPDCHLPGGNSNTRPTTPFPSKLYIESRIEKLKRKHPELTNAEALRTLMNKYKELSDKKKLKWIKKAMSVRQTYEDQVGVYLSHNPKSTKPALLHLSKEEERIWDSFKGKPLAAPPKNVFNFFCMVKRDTVHHLSISEQSRKLAGLYHKLTEEELKELTEEFKQEVEEYVQAYTLYYNSLSEEERSHEIDLEKALGVYNKILQEDQKKKKKKSKSSTAEDANDKKMKRLSDVLPRPNPDSDSDSDDSLPSSGIVAPTAKVNEPVTPKKRKHVAISDAPAVPAHNDELDEKVASEAKINTAKPKKRKHVAISDVPAVPAHNDEFDEKVASEAKINTATPKKRRHVAISDAPEVPAQNDELDEKVASEAKINTATPKKRRHAAISDAPEVPAQNDELDEKVASEAKINTATPKKRRHAATSDTPVVISDTPIVPAHNDELNEIVALADKLKTEPATPKKHQHVAISYTPAVPAQNDELDEDNLLSMWSPLPNNDIKSPAEDIDDTPSTSKSSKKAKRSKR